jgi:hypothetical protein
VNVVLFIWSKSRCDSLLASRSYHHMNQIRQEGGKRKGGPTQNLVLILFRELHYLSSIAAHGGGKAGTVSYRLRL